MIDYSNLTFDNFRSFCSKDRKRILNDYELIKIMVRNNMKEKRYMHSLSVADTAKMLAECHHVSADDAYLAGLLHDVTKELSEEVHDSYLKFYDALHLDSPLPVKHAYSAKFYLKEKLNLHNSKVLNAIYNHTIITSRDKLSVILYIADKREPLRNINDNILEIAKNDLMKAYRLLEENVQEYLKERNTDGQIIRNSI